MQTLAQLTSGALAGAQQIKIAAGLTEFPRQILDLAATLEVLDLSNNQLQELPADFSRLQHLKILFLSDNNFTSFPRVLSACPQLEMVGFKANKITHIPENALPPQLRWLILTNNALTHLPASIGACTRLQKCMVAGNNLQSLPPQMGNCQNLELLRLSANKLTALPDWLQTLPRLAWLAVAGNPFITTDSEAPDPLPFIAWPEIKIAEQLGQGASGNIYKGYWETAGTPGKAVAVKVFKGEVTSDGLPADEMAACVAAGRHPVLVPVLGKIANHPEQKQGLVLDLIPPDFRNLGNPPSFATCTRDTYPTNTQFSSEMVLQIASDMASAAAHLHTNKLMHGDLYAHNILINAAGKPLFGDFGAATVYRGQPATWATWFERLEVRAFGYLLDDLLQHLTEPTANPDGLLALQNLRAACLHEDAFQRPGFNQIVSELNQIQEIFLPE